MRPKGTIAILADWLEKMFRPRDPKPLEETLATFRKVRTLRNKPSHSAVEDIFRAEFINEQRALMREAYEAVRCLRLILANHPAARTVEVDESLYKGMIWSE